MKKTISVNIGGYVFNIEEEAYQQLYQYLNAIKKNFKASEDCEEIMNDIELRIAEIFRSRNTQKEVVIEKDVDFVIQTMGKPEDYISEGFDQDSKIDSEKDSYYRNTHEKRLFRDTENATLGGVCSGLSHYFNMDVSIIRIALVLITLIGFGTGVLIYIIMFFIVPEAKTTADKLQMKGHSITIESIKEHFYKLKNDISENTKNGNFSKLFNNALYNGAYIGSTFVKIIVVVISASFLIGGILVLPLIFTIFFGDSGLLPLADGKHSIGLFTIVELLSPLNGFSDFFFLALLFTTLLPILGIILTGAKILFKFSTPKYLGIAMSLLWFLSLGFIIISGINLGMNFKNRSSLEHTIQSSNPKELLIDISEDTQFSKHLSYNDVWNHSEFIRVDKDRVLLGYPKLEIVEKEDSSDLEIILHKSSNGLTSRDAIEKAEHIEYTTALVGNQLTLAPFFSFPRSDKFRNQQTKVEVRVPKGSNVTLGKGMDRINVAINGDDVHKKSCHSRNSWAMGKKRIKCKEHSHSEREY